MRTGSRAVILQCLSYIALHYPHLFASHFSLIDQGMKVGANQHNLAESIEKQIESCENKEDQYVNNNRSFTELLDLVTFPDPLVRGSAAQVISCFIAGILQNPNTKVCTVKVNKNEDKQESMLERIPVIDLLDMDKLVKVLLSLLLDESANTRKMTCRALMTCFNSIAGSKFALHSLKILYALLDSIRDDTYWLVKTEVRI